MLRPRAADRTQRMFRAFSDRTRLRILPLLRDGELCVGDIMHILGAPQARTSRHLAYLRTCGLVRVRREGIWSFYSLAPARDSLHRRLLGCLRDLPGAAADARRARRIRKGGGCCPK